VLATSNGYPSWNIVVPSREGCVGVGLTGRGVGPFKISRTGRDRYEESISDGEGAWAEGGKEGQM
jgi:hypothetical protein